MQDDLRERLSNTLRELHTELGIPADYAADGGLPVYAEASRLVEIGPNSTSRASASVAPARSTGPIPPVTTILCSCCHATPSAERLTA